MANCNTLTAHDCEKKKKKGKCITGVYASGAVGNCIPPLDFNLCRTKIIYCNVNRNSQVFSLGNINVVDQRSRASSHHCAVIM